MIIERTADMAPVRAAWPPAEARPWRHLQTVAWWWYLAALVAVWMVMRQAGDRWWPATAMLMGPRWPYLAPLVVLWPWLLASRRWRMSVIGVAATWFVLVQVMGFRVPLGGVGKERGDVRVLTCNVHRQHLDAAKLGDYVTAMHPDVVAIQGWSATDHEFMFTGEGWHVKREGELFVASRMPIERVTPLVLSEDDNVPFGQRGVAALFELKSERGTVSLISVHLASPHAGLVAMSGDGGGTLKNSVARRWRESDTLQAIAEDVQGPLIIMGDFNTTDDSPIFREHWSGYADAFLTRGWGLGYTYMNAHTQFRIDHVLAGSAWMIDRWSIGPDVGSPHRPLVADLSFR